MSYKILQPRFTLPLSFSIALFVLSGPSWASGFLLFDASRHIKSQGALLTVNYPDGFAASESARERVIQRFVGTYGGIALAMTLGIEAGEGDVEAYCASRTTEHWRKTYTTAQMKVLDVQNVRWNNRPAVMIEGAQFMKVGGYDIYSQSSTFSICNKRHRISLTCAISSTSSSEAKDLMKKALPTCAKFYDSLRFKE